MRKYYRIADLAVEMNTYGRTARQAEAYVCQQPQEIDVKVSSFRELYMKRYSGLSEEECEYLGTAKSFYQQLVNYGGLMLHSSAVVVDGRAYLFAADSGTGKSTHTKLWLQRFGDRAFILNDDKPALRFEDGTWYAYGTPWSGKYDISVNTRAPLAGIAMLERGEQNRIKPFLGRDAVLAIYKQSNRMTETAEFRMKLLGLLDLLIKNVPIWELTCNMDMEAAQIAYEAMSKES